MAGPWEKYGGAQGGLPTEINGPPKPVDIPSGYQPAPGGGLTPITGGPADPRRPGGELDPTPKPAKPEDATQSEQTAAFLTTRLVGALNRVAGAVKADPSAAKPPLLPKVVGYINKDAANAITDSDRQIVEAAQLDAVDAALTLGTGAAYTPEQLESYRQAYFPQIGDSAETIKSKQKAFNTLIEAAKLKAGKSVSQIDAALAAAGLAPQENVTPPVDLPKELEARVARGDDPAATIQWLLDNDYHPSKEMLAQIVANKGNPNPKVVPPNETGHQLGVGVGGILQGAGDFANIVSTPFVNGVNAVFGTDFNPDMGANLRATAGTPEPQNNAERAAYAVSRGGTAAMAGAGGARAAAPYVSGAVGNALASFGNSPLTDATAGATGTLSAEGARQAGAGPVGQVAAGLVGGGLSLPASGRVNALMARPAQVETALTRAGTQEGVTVNRAMVDPASQQRLVGTGKTMVGGRMMQRGMKKIGDQIEGGVQQLGRDGQPLEQSVAGDTIRTAAERSIKTSGQQLGRRYDALEKEVGNIKVAPTNSLQRVDDAISRLSETSNTNKAEIGFLNELKQDLSKDLSVGALRRLRTSLRKKISKGELTFGDDEATVLSIMDTAADDISTGLRAAGKGGAANKFKLIDGQYRERMQFIGGTVQKLIGKRGANLSPEQVYNNFRNMASPKGNEAGLARMVREMTPEEQGDIAATFADALGKNGDGEFSTAFLVKQAQKLPQTAKVHIFGPEGAKSLNNLVELAKAHKRVMHALGGSPTGLANDYKSLVYNLVFGGGAALGTGSGATGVAVGAGLLAAKTGRDALNARTLLNPSIQKWLRSAPRTTDPKAINAHFDRLKAIAVREPALAPEIRSLQQMIMKAANDTGATRAAASQGGEQNN